MVDVGGIASERLRTIIERVERLEEEKAALAEDIKEIFSEAKAAGFDVKILRQVIRLRKLDSSDRQEQEAILDLYKRALDME
ncbi:MAG: DUF2312 domain-containing protein [Rhodospirillaceae bacterium]|jgi:uncharacterized protein (UPF0335 family)|nr:DUF2312 domain-containing protein [Rhodospirillaceae bacterium]MBT4590276.1 DUF2312 domain-containing protein [Rhodospirillaceae bacterium]MBT5940700.1 DUF2312 domain-containing protein [Rhodospirillaceae bacterium]MBT7265936.1 DUF2312 domain-containing protein [Rhodospirillaceae bacterium]